MTSQLPSFWCLFLSCQQQKNTENGAAVTSFLFRDDFKRIKRRVTPKEMLSANQKFS